MSSSFEYVLGLGDDALVLAQRLSEWCARAPELEEDVALANIALDQLGAARLLLSLVGDEDELAYLRTDREFEDFNLTLEARLAKGGNSGVYLRGIYEVQVADTYGKPLDPHNMGAIYSRIRPSESVEKPPGEWQTFDITLCDRHATVVLNGKKIIDNQPLLGCTGGALWSDEMRPGPIYLQGDHAGIEYRNIILRPIIK